MKNCTKILNVMLIALVVISYGYTRDVAAENDKVDKAWQGSPSSRTWVIISIDEPAPDDFHFSVGDAFRIEKGAYPQFAPLSVLRGRWGVENDIRFQLEKIESANPRLCTEFTLSNHHKVTKNHYLVIDPPGHGRNRDNEMELAIVEDDGTACEDIEIKNHGGRAHAEN